VALADENGTPPPLVSLNSNPLLKVKPFFDFFLDPNPLENNPLQPATPDFNPTVTSEYDDSESFSAKFNNSNKLVISSLNVKSLNSKFDSLRDFLLTLPTSVQIIALQETWKIPHTFAVQIENFNFFHRERINGNGGGVGFYVSQNLNATIVDRFSTFIPKIFETITIEIVNSAKKIFVSSIYRSPSSDFNTFFSHLDDFLFSLSSLNSTCYICLDSNINTLPFNNSHPNFPYYRTLFENGFFQCLDLASRFSKQSYTAIDHIVTNVHSENIYSGVIVTDVSDHFMTYVVTPDKPPPPPKDPPPSRSFPPHKIENFKIALSNIGWETVLRERDTDSAFDVFWEIFYPLLELYFPIKKAKFNKNFHKINNFMTEGLLISRITKIKLHKKQVVSPTQQNVNIYKIYCNLYNKILRASRKMYFNTELDKAKSNPKRTWCLLKEALNLQSSSNNIQKLTLNGNSTIIPTEIAAGFNSHFAGAGRKVANSIPPSSTPPENFLPQKTFPNFILGQTNPVEICDIIKAFQPKTSSDMNGLSMKLIKEIRREISVPLCHIFNLSLSQGKFPSRLKLSRLIPVHKGGRMDICDNYRPIALQSNISKILEKFVCIRLVNHLELNKIIHPNQFGFQRNKNTQHNLVALINYISKALNDGEYCIGIFLDLKKAFDTVDHSILLRKLNHYGVGDVELQWFKCYLTDRTQVVDINGHFSDPEKIDISVLQGSILGPILFDVFVNDLPDISTLITYLFADDTQGLMKNKSLSVLIDNVNIELLKCSEWFRANKLGVNVDKTKYIIFHTKGKRVELAGKDIVFDNNDPLIPYNPDLVTKLERYHSGHESNTKKAYKLLGIYLDENLSLNYHIPVLLSKLAKANFMLSRSKNLLP